MKPNPVGWFEIYVEDMSRARKFYENIFQTQLSDLPNPEMKMTAFPMEREKWGAAGALVQMPGLKAGGNSTIVYFTSEDCSVEEGRVQKAGGAIFKSKMSIGEYGFITLAKDSEGNIFGIHSMK